MEVSFDSMIKKSFYSRNYDEKLGIAEAEKPTPKVDNIKWQIRLLEKVLDVGSHNKRI